MEELIGRTSCLDNVFLAKFRHIIQLTFIPPRKSLCTQASAPVVEKPSELSRVVCFQSFDNIIKI